MAPSPIQSITGKSNYLIFGVGALFFGFLGYKIGLEAWQSQPPTVLVSILAGICTLGALFCLMAPWLFYRILIREDHIEFIQFFGLRNILVWRHELVSYEIQNRKSRHSSRVLLKLYTSHDHYTIDAQMYANYHTLENALTAGLPRVYSQEKSVGAQSSAKEIFVIVLYWVIAAGGLWGLGKCGFAYSIDETQLVRLAGTLYAKPAIQTYTSNRSTRKILTLPIQEHPDLHFDLKESAFRAAYAAEFAQNLNAGDSIFIRIDREDYLTKITKEKPPGFWAKHLGGTRQVEVFELTAKDNLGYLTIPNYEFVFRRTHQVDLVLFILVMAAIFFYYRREQKKEQLSQARQAYYAAHPGRKKRFEEE